MDRTTSKVVQAIAVVLNSGILLCIFISLLAPWYHYSYTKFVPGFGNVTAVADEYLTRKVLETEINGKTTTASKAWDEKEPHLRSMYQAILGAQIGTFFLGAILLLVILVPGIASKCPGTWVKGTDKPKFAFLAAILSALLFAVLCFIFVYFTGHPTVFYEDWGLGSCPDPCYDFSGPSFGPSAGWMFCVIAAIVDGLLIFLMTYISIVSRNKKKVTEYQELN